ARMLAKAEGVALTEADIEEHVAFLATLAPELMPSMRQDRLKCRPSEVELFAGTVLRLAAKHGIAVPVNDWLYRRVKEIEAAY
ncbi:MAG: ketopantoate reductase family protein, partial [Clostridia bacterium]|nr:ketopantoate reductase family protein [Clostridia bacterium]